MSNSTPFDFTKFIDEGIASCPTEAKILRKIIRALKKAGTPVVSVFDGAEYVDVETERQVFEQVFNLDESFLYTADGSWVRFTMGNEQDCITDYTTDLEDRLSLVNEWIERKFD